MVNISQQKYGIQKQKATDTIGAAKVEEPEASVEGEDAAEAAPGSVARAPAALRTETALGSMHDVSSLSPTVIYKTCENIALSSWKLYSRWQSTLHWHQHLQP